MSKSLIPLDSPSGPEQHPRYEHVAHEQQVKHMAQDADAQPSGRTERVQLLLSHDEVEAVDTFRFANRCSSRSDAIRVLLKRGMEQPSNQ